MLLRDSCFPASSATQTSGDRPAFFRQRGSSPSRAVLPASPAGDSPPSLRTSDAHILPRWGDAGLVSAASLAPAGCSQATAVGGPFFCSVPFSTSLNWGRCYEEALLIYLSYCSQEKATRRNVPSGRPKILFPCRPLPLYCATRRRSGKESGAKPSVSVVSPHRHSPLCLWLCY